MVYIFCTVCILCYIVYRLCHNQYNCRYISYLYDIYIENIMVDLICRLRRRQNTLARLISAVDF